MRCRYVIALCAGLLVSAPALALQVGPGFHLTSAKGQPFEGEVPLRDVAGMKADDISVELGNSADFTSLGIVRANFLSGFRFAVIIDPAGQKSCIKITSDIPVDESSVEFVLRISWPGGSQVLAEMVPLQR